jgi:predicted ATPase
MLDWSYDRISEQERVVLRRLSIFPDKYSLEAAIAVAAGGEMAVPAVIDHIMSLVTKSLIAADISGNEPSYRMLETTRCYALEKLRESGEYDAVAGRHAEGCQDLLRQAAAE